MTGLAARLTRRAFLVGVPWTPMAVPHFHHHLHGPSLGYLGIGLAAAASWAGIPGPGETALIAGGILAARERLDLAELLVVAWLGAMVGGIAGWALGRRTGRPLLTARGPLHRQRMAAMVRGERFFARFGVLAVYFAPSWVAGSTGLGAPRFIVANAIAALIWVCLVGVGAYAVGPAIADVVGDIGLIGPIAVGALAVAGIAYTLTRRPRRR
jgi:membrane protein DedA with SNARE-associated domain